MKNLKNKLDQLIKEDEHSKGNKSSIINVIKKKVELLDKNIEK